MVADGGLPDLGGLDLDAALVRRVGEVLGERHAAQWARLTRPADPAQRRDQVRLWDEVRGAKETLSRSVVAPVAVPGVPETVQLTRADVERVATPLLHRAVQRAREVIADAGLTPDQLAGLFLVGGSSRMPLVARMLHAELGIAPTVLDQPELPVAEGALTDLPLRRQLPTPAYAGPRLAAPGTRRAGRRHRRTCRTVAALAGSTPPAARRPGRVGPAAPVPGGGRDTLAAGALGGARRGAGPGRGGRRGDALPDPGPLSGSGVPVAEGVVRPSAGAERPADMWTAVLDDRAYLAFPLPDDRLEVVAVDAASGDELWRKPTDARADDWEAVIAVPGGRGLADAPGDSTLRPLAVLDGRTEAALAARSAR
ncbi:Hsp70 family protein [Micromonospora sp. M12]